MFTVITCKSANDNEKQYKIVYNVLLDEETDNYEIFSMNMDGSDKRNISNLAGVEWTYFAYKDKVYFISDKDTCHRCYYLYKMNADGKNVEKVTDTQLADSWMDARKNGTELIIRPTNKVDTAFYIINTNTGSLITRIKPELPYFNDPVFIPDTDIIIFRGSYSSFKKDRTSVDELFILNTDGSELRQLTTYPENDTTAEWFNYHAGPPQWNPKENFISYQSLQNGKYSLYAITPDGKKQWKLTDNKQSEGWHSWSPDGKWLAIGISDLEKTHYDIAIMNWETKEMKILTDTTFKYQQAPVFVEM
jgi:TolB protein